MTMETDQSTAHKADRNISSLSFSQDGESSCPRTEGNMAKSAVSEVCTEAMDLSCNAGRGHEVPSTSSTNQPLVIGNFNATNLLSALMRQAGGNQQVINHQTVNPMIVQVAQSSHSDSTNNKTIEDQAASLSSMKTILLDHNSIEKTEEASNDSKLRSFLLLLSSVKSEDNKTPLSASDTVILSTASGVQAEMLAQTSSNVSSLPTLVSVDQAGNLLPQISDRVVSLQSIPTVSLFNPTPSTEKTLPTSTRMVSSVNETSDKDVTSLPTIVSIDQTGNLLSQISNRLVSLQSIPTVSIFNPSGEEIKPTFSNIMSSSQASNKGMISTQSSLSQDKQFAVVGNKDVPQSILVYVNGHTSGDSSLNSEQQETRPSTQLNQLTELGKSATTRRLRSSSNHSTSTVEGEGELQISMEDPDSQDTVYLEKTELDVERGSLSKDDTIIISDHNEQGPVPQLSASDTVLLQKNDTLAVDQTDKLTEGFSLKSLASLSDTSPLLQSLCSLGSKLSLILPQDLPSFEKQSSVVPVSLIQNESFAKLIGSSLSDGSGQSGEAMRDVTSTPDSGQSNVLNSLSSMDHLQALASLISFSSTKDGESKESQSTQTDIALGGNFLSEQVLQLLSQMASSQQAHIQTQTDQTVAAISTEQMFPIQHLDQSDTPTPLSSEAKVQETVVTQEGVPLIKVNTKSGQTSKKLPMTRRRSRRLSQGKDSEFSCTVCSVSFSTEFELRQHKAAHKKAYKCDLCTATFTRIGNFKRHRKIHNLQTESQNMFKCEECGREFLQRCDLKRHLLIHSKQEPHRCDKCGKGYIRRSDLVVHMRFHNKDRAFKCTLCEKSFFQSGDLNRHMRRAHFPNSELTCGHCDKKYACESTLIRHMKDMHKDIIMKTVNQRLSSASTAPSNTSGSDPDSGLVLHFNNEQEETNQPSQE